MNEPPTPLPSLWPSAGAVLVPEVPVPLGEVMTWIQVAAYVVLAWTARAVYKDAMHALRTFPMHLRSRRPVDCGEGRPSEAGLVECATPPKPKRYANRSDAKVAREQEEARAKRRALPANRHGSGDDLSGWDDVIRAEVERLASTTRPAFTVSRPSPIENARRYAAEGGTW